MNDFEYLEFGEQRMRLILLFVALLVLAPKGFAETFSYECNFPLSASPYGIKKESKPFKLSFVFDTKTKKAYMLGNNGSAEVNPIANNDGGITFIEVTQSGNVMVTAITQLGEAVHSRNGIFLIIDYDRQPPKPHPELIPSQSYGQCNVRP